MAARAATPVGCRADWTGRDAADATTPPPQLGHKPRVTPVVVPRPVHCPMQSPGRVLLACFAICMGIAVAMPPHVPVYNRAETMYATHANNAATTHDGKPLPAVNTAAVESTVKYIEGTVLDIQWLGEHHRHEVLFMVTDNGMLYRSSDKGRTWINQLPMLEEHTWEHHATTAHRGFYGIIVSPADSSVVLFEGEEGQHAVTADAGRTYLPVSHPEPLGEFKLHPTDKHLILASSLSHKCLHDNADGVCFKKLYLSRDMGRTWKHLQDYVVQFDWVHSLHRNQGAHQPVDAIFATLVSHKMGHQQFGVWDAMVNLVITKDLFETHETLVERGNRFLFTDKYMAVAQVAAVGHRVNLVLSSDGGQSFFPTGMPYEMAQHSYTILDTSEDTIFLHVNHAGDNAQWGHVYSSNSLGTNFTLSLPHNRRDANGKCDFEKLQSMEGVYIANYIDNAMELEQAEYRRAAGDMGQEGEGADVHTGGFEAFPEPKVMTVITHDKGSTWTYLTPPVVDANHQLIHCSASANCHLHLHGVTDVFGPFYSTPSAVGVLMATGCTGDRLCFEEGTINTYFSRDAGHTWTEVATGSHIYEMGDHGGLIVMANDEQPTDTVMYSWNEGLTWETHKFAAEPVLVDNIVTEPTSRSLEFMVYGTHMDGNGVRSGVVAHIDFNRLHTPMCKGLEAVGAPSSDYEHWAPSATGSHDMCLLGHTVMYVRRKQDRACINGLSHEPHHTVKHCQCTERDYECDFGYVREHEESGPCVRVHEVPIPTHHLKPKHCPPGAFYHVSDGHRKHPLTAYSCHPHPGHSWHGLFVLGLALMLFVCLCSLTFCQKNRMDPGSYIPIVGPAVTLVFSTIGGAAAWVWDRVPFRGGRGGGGGSSSEGYVRATGRGGAGGVQTFEFDEGDDDIGFDDLALADDDAEPTLLESSTINRAISSSSSLLSTAGGGRSRHKKRT